MDDSFEQVPLVEVNGATIVDVLSPPVGSGPPGGGVKKVSKSRLNDLSGKDWLVHTKTVMMGLVDREDVRRVEDALESGVMISQAPPRDVLKRSHPATFSESDVSKLVRFFTCEGDTVLDPFVGSGSTAIACMDEGRRCVGIELYPLWVNLAAQRVQAHGGLPVPTLIQGESLDQMRGMLDESVDFVVTSPPYWSVLGKVDHKAKLERVSAGLATTYGLDGHDLANVSEYAVFLSLLREHFQEYFRLLRPRKYAAVVVSDFRHGSRYYLFHAHVAEQMEMAGFVTQGVINLVQDNKRLYPYGYPTTYVPNVSNQFIVVGRKI